MTDNLKEKIEINKSFIENRTKFWKTLTFCLVFCFCFGILIWLFFSNDFEITNYWGSKSENQKILISTIINLFLFLFVIISSLFLYIIKFVKEDLIIYSSSFVSFIVSNNLNSFWLEMNSNIHVAIRIILSFVIAFSVMFLNIFITSLLRNMRLKKEEYWERVVAEYREGKELTDKEIFRIEKKIEYDKLKEIKHKAIIEAEKEKEEEKAKEYDEKIKIIEERIKAKDLNKKNKDKKKIKKKKKIKF